MVTYIFQASRRTYIYQATGGDVPAGRFRKDPAERYPVGITMVRTLPAGRTVSRATVSAIDMADDSDQTSVVLASTFGRVTDSYIVDVGVKAGVEAHRYKILYTIYDNANNLYKESLIMTVHTV